MANLQHLELLKQGTGSWNRWRSVHCTTIPDLSEANLEDIDLQRANLNGAHFTGANLQNTFLIAANLCGANLSRADGRSTLLYKANLTGADLTHYSCT